jgi:hypothetical protein
MTRAANADTRLAALALALCVPGAFVVWVMVTKFVLGVGIFYDPIAAIFEDRSVRWVGDVLTAAAIVGPALALAVSLRRLIEFRVVRAAGDPVASLTMRLSPPLLAVLVLCAFVLATIGIYGIVENLPCILGRQPTC